MSFALSVDGKLNRCAKLLPVVYSNQSILQETVEPASSLSTRQAHYDRDMLLF